MVALPHLIDVEARVLGVFLEKAFTTPDQYPLSLNAATNGCNQKSNRDPVTSFLQAEVEVGIHGLVQKHLAGRVLGAGSRVEKFRHTAKETLGLDDACLAVLAELLMRGPQSQGELRARVHRMVATPSLEELTPRLDRLIERGFVERRPPRAGSRAVLYAQLLAPGLHPHPDASGDPSAALPALEVPEPGLEGGRRPEPRGNDAREAREASGLEGRMSSLERRVDELQEKLDRLSARLGG